MSSEKAAVKPFQNMSSMISKHLHILLCPSAHFIYSATISYSTSTCSILFRSYVDFPNFFRQGFSSSAPLGLAVIRTNLTARCETDRSEIQTQWPHPVAIKIKQNLSEGVGSGFPSSEMLPGEQTLGVNGASSTGVLDLLLEPSNESHWRLSWLQGFIFGCTWNIYLQLKIPNHFKIFRE